MPRLSSKNSVGSSEVKTGRRLNTTFEARNQTVCFILSESEKAEVDQLAFCIGITRSGLLASIVTTYVSAARESKGSAEAEKSLKALLSECRKAWSAAHQQSE
jgi:hypothetical protein